METKATKLRTQRGCLKNGNPPGDFHDCARCGARARTTGETCKSPAMKNGRCRMHGGKSTGPRTEAGFERCRHSNRKHGNYAKIRTEWIWMDNQVAACLAVSGKILEGLVNWLATSTPIEIETRLRLLNQAIQKGEQVLQRIWANKQFQSFARKRNRPLQVAYRGYWACSLLNNPAESSLPVTEPLTRAGRLNELLHACVDILPCAFVASNHLDDESQNELA